MNYTYWYNCEAEVFITVRTQIFLVSRLEPRKFGQIMRFFQQLQEEKCQLAFKNCLLSSLHKNTKLTSLSKYSSLYHTKRRKRDHLYVAEQSQTSRRKQSASISLPLANVYHNCCSLQLVLYVEQHRLHSREGRPANNRVPAKQKMQNRRENEKNSPKSTDGK